MENSLFVLLTFVFLLTLQITACKLKYGVLTKCLLGTYTMTDMFGKIREDDKRLWIKAGNSKRKYYWRVRKDKQ